ncbi:MAG: hypothetical protein RSE13_12970 [Planktothrix sp. GU0601_MAG3]|nr:MAG: hypothetical protein RSE13_12970 [Planktothrix sp. GU0601_MAG3]
MKEYAGFLDDLATILFKDDVNGSKGEKEWFFKLRFHPDNYNIDNQNNKEKEDDLLSLIKKQLGYCQNNIQRLQTEVIKNLIKIYEKELIDDQIDIEGLQNLTPGQKGTWKKVYAWLWEYQFPRWEVDQIWKRFQTQTGLQQNWIEFSPNGERGMVWKDPQPNSAKIPCDQPLQMKINLEYPNHYFLLFNRGFTSRFLVCPSLAFAPTNKISESPMILPQMGSIAFNNQIAIEFNQPGIEEYLGIVSEFPLNLEALNQIKDQQFPSVKPELMLELWQQFEKQNKTRWHIFYQKFEVLPPLKRVE